MRLFTLYAAFMEAIGPVLEILNRLWEPTARQIGYVKDFKENSAKLQQEIGALIARRDDVRHLINIDEVEMQPSRECENWLKGVEDIEFEVNGIQTRFEEEKKCMKGLCPNVYSRWKLGKCLVIMINKVTTHVGKSNFRGKEVINAPVETSEQKQVPKVEANTSIERTLQKTMELVRNVGIKKIGIWGMGGIGKTTVMRHLNNHPEIVQMFDIVIWVTASRDHQKRRMQNEIAQRLGLDVSDNETDDRLQARLHRHLASKKFLLLLDDVWEVLALHDIGIPDFNEQNDCKVVLTTRHKEICNHMKTEQEIHVDVLTEEEAWCLFHENAGDVVMLGEIEPLARDVAKECNGLPLAIIVVGSSLRKESDIRVWRSALKKLRSSSQTHAREIEEKVFETLKFSFDRLPNDIHKNCFLYCALYPEDHMIHVPKLIRYWIGECFFNGEGSFSDMEDECHWIVKLLVEESLLQRCEREGYVKMHDVIRDLALRITSSSGEGSRLLVRAGVGLMDLPEERDWEQCKWISLMSNELQSLDKKPKCPSLSTLLLPGNNNLTSVSTLFFNQMQALRVLDLSQTKVSSLPPCFYNLTDLQFLDLSQTQVSFLPSSFCNLTNLRFVGLSSTKINFFPTSLCDLTNLQYLYLDSTEVSDLPSSFYNLTKLRVLHVGSKTFAGISYQIGALKCLEELYIHIGYKIVILPNEIGELACLKRLLVSFNGLIANLKVNVPVGAISRLCQLEKLGLQANSGNDNVDWNDEGVVQVVVEELSNLEHLQYLDFYFPNVECFDCFLQRNRSWRDKRLSKFRFWVGNYCSPGKFKLLYTWRHIEEGKNLIYTGGNGTFHTSICQVLSHCSSFALFGDRAAQTLSDFGMENIEKLETCRIKECSEMIIIIHSIVHDGYGAAILPRLAELHVERLQNLRSFWEGPVPPGSLSKLRDLYLLACPKLRKIFSSRDTIQQLCNLVNLNVKDCMSMEEIISVEEEEITYDYQNRTPLLPNLGILSLHHLPELTSICRGILLDWPSLKTIHISGCPKLKSLSSIIHSKNAGPKLEKIVGDEEWWEALEWEDDDVEQRLHRLYESPSYYRPG